LRTGKNDHGPIHAAKVCVLCALLGAKLELPIDNIYILMFAAIAHDSGRTDNKDDRKHGALGVKTLLFADMETTRDLVALHSQPDSYINKIASEEIESLAMIFKDADVLDRVRTGDLEEKYLRTDEAKSLVRFARELNLCLSKVTD